MKSHPAWVLVVGEDAGDRLALFRSLERAEYHATVAGAEQALRLLDEEPFDAVLLDDAAQHANELELVALDARRRHIPVIRTSDLDDLFRVGEAIDAGLNPAAGQ
jgi:PleD family two-component response regulator